MEDPELVEKENYLNKFNWGAFMLSFLWAIGNKAYLGLLVLIPFFNIIWIFVCGFKGNRWAWENNNYRDIEEFKRVQETWNRAGLVALIIYAVIIVLYIVVFAAIIGGIMNRSYYSSY